MREQQGLDASMDIRTERQAEQGATAVSQNAFGQILEGQSIVVRKNSAGTEVIQPRINLIEGANIAITLADDPVNSEADVTLALSANPDVTSLKVAGTKVIGARVTGWQTFGAGAPLRDASGFDTGTITIDKLAKFVMALMDDLIAHGVIGP